MMEKKSDHMQPKGRGVLYALPFILIILSLACSLPGVVSQQIQATEPAPIDTPTPAPTPTPTEPPEPLPPALLESDPYPVEELSLKAPIRLYFNQPMDRDSVEAALSVQPAQAGSFSWDDDATLVFTPGEPYAPGSEISFEIGTGALSAQGLSLPEPVSLNFSTVGYLRLAQSLPADGGTDIDPTSAIVAAFNRPVVPLGAEAESLPAAFTINPVPEGRGEWLNTSTYVFYPEPGLAGGVNFAVSLEASLTALDGSPLDPQPGPQQPYTWSFSTASPRLLTIKPEPDLSFTPLDSKVELTFNQPMEPASVESNFILRGPGGEQVDGAFEWSDDFRQMTFTPDRLLVRSAQYTFTLSAEARSGGGTTLEGETRASFYTVTPLGVSATTPAQGGTITPRAAISIYLNGPLGDLFNLADYVGAEPQVPDLSAWYNDFERTLNVYGNFEPETDYVLTISPDLPDPWGGSLGQAYTLSFSTGLYDPSLIVTGGSDVIFLTPADPAIYVQATNLFSLPMTQGSLPLEQFFELVAGDNAYELRQSYRSPDEQAWVQSLDLASNRSQEVLLDVAPDSQPLPSGLYYLRVNANNQRIFSGPYFLVVGNVHLTFKLGATQAFVWAINLQDGTPAAGSQISIYDKNGATLASGQTDDQGVFIAPLSALEQPYDTYFAVAGEIGEPDFGLALSTWNRGTAAWDSGLRTDYAGPRLEAYLYTDRPIYRPGQTVYYRGILRHAFNGRYELPDLTEIPISMYGDTGQEIDIQLLPLSDYGTFQGEFNLPQSAKPGYYRLGSPQENAHIQISTPFQVAEYRKPEINLEVSFGAEQLAPGEPLEARVSARYFFDAPAGDVGVQWNLYEIDTGFSLSGYQVGTADTRWLDPIFFPDYAYAGYYGPSVEQGQGVTDPQGLLELSFDVEPAETRKRYTLEVTARDESNLPVSARGSVLVNPGDIFIGVRPDAWVGQAGTPADFEVLTVDWEANPVPAQGLRAEFSKVVWVRNDPDDPYGFPTFTPEYTLVGSTDFETGERGAARLAFTPPEAGTYQLDVIGDGARTEVILWVGGQGDPVWPNLPNKRLQLIAGRDKYLPGDTAQVFVPNPLGSATNALITLERGEVIQHQMRQIAPGGETLSIPIESIYAPNVYLSVTLIDANVGRTPDYRHGYLNLPVDPLEQELQVSLASQPERAGPRDPVAFEIEVRDASGDPVQAEFSLSVVDRATLALADPNVPAIEEAFYGEQPLGVRTGLPLSAYGLESVQAAPGGGGGGGDALQTIVREEFPDTAYWNASIVTAQDGRARVEMQLPDNLTTWQVLVRGVDHETRVGQVEMDLVATKELLVRPVTPRFLVVGDHVELAAIVQNNTSNDLDVDVSLEAGGMLLDEPESANQMVSVPAAGRTRLAWWGTVQDVEAVDLLFSASAGDLSDATRPTQGALPVLRYTAPQTFRTAGVIEDQGEVLELVSLPRSFDPSGGELNISLASSLAGTMLDALDVLEHYPYQCTEQTLSRFLPNLETYRVFQQFDLEAPAIESRLDRTLQEGLDELIARQNDDGGWGWWQDDPSDPFVTAYVLFGLSRAQDAGIDVNNDALNSAIVYLSATLTPPGMSQETWQLDRQVFIQFALYQAGAGDRSGVDALYLERERLNPGAKALLALLLAEFSEDGERARSLISDLEATAIRSAAGAHWESIAPSPQNMTSPVATSAMVVYVLARRNPGSTLLGDAVRYLVVHREQGAWGSTYATAWTLMAFAETLKGTGELGGDFAFSADLNGAPLLSGTAGGNGAATTATVPISDLRPDMPNALTIQREPGLGRLYYDAALSVLRPVEQVEPLSQGIHVSRAYYPLEASCQDDLCAPVREATAGDLIQVHLTLSLEQAAYYLVIEDYLPAGAEVLDTSLKTSRQAPPELSFPEETEPQPLYSVDRPFRDGWGWWLFGAPQVYDERVTWAANFLPAGTYDLTYTLVISQPGEYRLLPARAWQFYFPEVQGNSAGAVFEIHPGE